MDGYIISSSSEEILSNEYCDEKKITNGPKYFTRYHFYFTLIKYRNAQVMVVVSI